MSFLGITMIISNKNKKIFIILPTLFILKLCKFHVVGTVYAKNFLKKIECKALIRIKANR